MERTDITVIILTSGQTDQLPLCLAHLEFQSYPSASYDVLIVDSAAGARTAGLLDRFAPGGPVRIGCICAEGKSPAAARNLAVSQAKGRWLLFLDDELLAGTRLVEQHVAMQEREGDACVAVGRVDYHPQIAPRTFSRPYLRSSLRFLPNQPLSFLDWRAYNMSVPRTAVIEAGGFDESVPFSGLEDIDLGYRLEKTQELRGFFADEACAFLWRPATVASETHHFYREGYWLHTLLSKTKSDRVRERYRPMLSSWRALVDKPFLPVSRILCPLLANDTALFSCLARRRLRSEFRRGFNDAAHGRPPQVVRTEANSASTGSVSAD